MDVKLKKTLYHIIMNHKFDCEIYKIPIRAHGDFIKRVEDSDG